MNPLKREERNIVKEDSSESERVQGGYLGDGGSLRLLIILAILTSPPSGLMYSVYAPYLRSLGFTASEYGALSALSLILSLLASLLAGILSDRIGARTVLLISAMITSLGLIILASGLRELVYVAAVLFGFSGGLWHVTYLVLTSRMPGVSLERAISYTTATSTIGGGIGALGGWIPVFMSSNGFDIVNAYRAILFLVSPLVFLPSLIILPRIREAGIEAGIEKNDSGEKRTEEVGRINWSILGKLVVINVIISLGAGASIHLIDYYFVIKFGVTSGKLGTLIGLQNFVMGILMFQMPKVSNAIGGPLRAYFIIAGPSILLLALLIPATSFTVAATIYIIRSTLMNVASPLYQSFEMSLIPLGFRGRGASMLSIAWQIPAGIGRSIGGALMDLNVEAPIMLTTGLYTLSFMLLLLFFPEDVLKKGNNLKIYTKA